MSEALKSGKILKGHSGLYTVKSGEDIILCRAASKIRKEAGIKLLAGDDVLFYDNKDGSGFIEEVGERRNSFVRPAVANVDMIAIVASAGQPEPVPHTIDKLTMLAVNGNAEVYIIITKSDIAAADFLTDIYRKTPFLLTVTNIFDKEGINEVRERLRGRITVLTGASGVGKSSLINRLYPFLDTEVGELSEKIKRGKNTTRVTEFYALRQDTYIADTPGFGMLDYRQCGEVGLRETAECFPDIMPYSDKCRYKKCTHTKEEGCAVIAAVRDGHIAVSRHESYIALYNEVKKP